VRVRGRARRRLVRDGARCRRGPRR
jgi:hypothetical protein